MGRNKVLLLLLPVDMEFLFDCSTLDHKKRNSISTSSNVLFCLLCKHSNDEFLHIFRRFPKILQQLSEGQTIVTENFTKMSEDVRRLSKITKNFPGRADDVSIIQGHI